MHGLTYAYLMIFGTSKPRCSSFVKHMLVSLSYKPLLDTLVMDPASLGVHLIIKYRPNRKVFACPYPTFCVLLVLVVQITIPPSIPPYHMYAPMNLSHSESLSPQGCGGIRFWFEICRIFARKVSRRFVQVVASSCLNRN